MSSNNDGYTYIKPNTDNIKIDALLIVVIMVGIMIFLLILRFIVNLFIDLCILCDINIAIRHCSETIRYICPWYHRRTQPTTTTTTNDTNDADVAAATTSNDNDHHNHNHNRSSIVELTTFGSILDDHQQHDKDDKDDDERDIHTRIQHIMNQIIPSTIITNEWFLQQQQSEIPEVSTTTKHVHEHNIEDGTLYTNNNKNINNDIESGNTSYSSSNTNNNNTNSKLTLNQSLSTHDNDTDINNHMDHTNNNNNNNNHTICSICLHEFYINQSIYQLPLCHHYYHTECIQQWILQQISVSTVVSTTTTLQQQHHQRGRQHQQQSSISSSPSTTTSTGTTTTLRNTQQQQQQHYTNNNNNIQNHCPNCRTPIHIPRNELYQLVSLLVHKQQLKQQQM